MVTLHRETIVKVCYNRYQTFHFQNELSVESQVV